MKKPAREFDRLAAEHEAHGRVDNSKFEDRLNGVIRVEWFEAGARWQFEKDSAEFERLEAQFLEAIAYVKAGYPADILPDDGNSIDCLSARMARLTCDYILAKFEELKNEQ